MRKLKTGTIKTLCYIGDLPDRRIDGITSSFARNISILSNQFRIISCPENSSLQQPSLKKLTTVINFWKDTKRFLQSETPDVCYINLPTTFLGLFKQFVLLQFILDKNIKVVLHVHRGDFLKQIKRSPSYRALVIRIIKRVEKVIVLSSSESIELNNYFNTNVFVPLPNTIDAPAIKCPHERSGFLFVSNYLESKGIFDLLEVFADLKKTSYRLDCYGHFPSEKYKERLFDFVSPSITINGPILNEEKYIMMQSAKCLILPSRSEGQPLVILEAMSQGLPVIASDVGFVKELLGEDYRYYVPAKNKDALREKILEVAESQEMPQTGMSLKERYEKNFSTEVHKNQLIEIFKPLMN